MENENINNQGPVIDNNPSAPAGNAKLFAILSYFCPLWLLGLLIEPEKNDPYVKNHVNNGIILTIVGVASGVIAAIPVVGWIISSVVGIASLVFAIIGIVKACQNTTYILPLIGDKFVLIK